MIINESLVVAVAFVAFVSLVFKPVRNGILSMLDEKIALAINDLKHAQSLRADAESHLANARQALEEAEAQALEIVENAQSRAQRLIDEVEYKVAEATKAKSEMAMARIAQQQEKIINDLQKQAVETASKLAIDQIMTELSKDAQLDVIKDTLKRNKRMMH